jgi:pimeloyl-ACP methyl ester carboxylesterase
VYAIDLLGFGRSDKPLLDYSTELWRDQLLDFLAEFIDRPAVLIGNSIGSLVSLMVRVWHTQSAALDEHSSACMS